MGQDRLYPPLSVKEWLSPNAKNCDALAVRVDTFPLGFDVETAIDIVFINEDNNTSYTFNMYEASDFETPIEYIRTIRTTLRILLSRLKEMRAHMEEKEKKEKEKNV